MFKLLYDSKYYLLGKDLFNNTEGRTTLNILFWDIYIVIDTKINQKHAQHAIFFIPQVRNL